MQSESRSVRWAAISRTRGAAVVALVSLLGLNGSIASSDPSCGETPTGALEARQANYVIELSGPAGTHRRNATGVFAENGSFIFDDMRTLFSMDLVEGAEGQRLDRLAVNFPDLGAQNEYARVDDGVLVLPDCPSEPISDTGDLLAWNQDSISVSVTREEDASAADVRVGVPHMGYGCALTFGGPDGLVPVIEEMVCDSVVPGLPVLKVTRT